MSVVNSSGQKNGQHSSSSFSVCKYTANMMAKLCRSPIFHLHLDPQLSNCDNDFPVATNVVQDAIGKSPSDSLNSNDVTDETEVWKHSNEQKNSGNQRVIMYKQYKLGKMKVFAKPNYAYKVTGIKVNEYAVIRTDISYTKKEISDRVLNTTHITLRHMSGGVNNGQYNVAKSEIEQLNINIAIDILKFFDEQFIADMKQVYLKKAIELFRGKPKTMEQLNSIIRNALAHALTYLMEQNRPQDFNSIDEMHEAMRRCIFIVSHYKEFNTVEDQLFSSMVIPCFHAAIMLVFNLDIPTTLTPLELLLDFKNNQVNKYNIARVENSAMVNVPQISRPDVLPTNTMGPFHYTEKQLATRIETCTGKLFSKNEKRFKQYPLSSIKPDLEKFAHSSLSRSKKRSLQTKSKKKTLLGTKTLEDDQFAFKRPYQTRSCNVKQVTAELSGEDNDGDYDGENIPAAKYSKINHKLSELSIVDSDFRYKTRSQTAKGTHSKVNSVQENPDDNVGNIPLVKTITTDENVETNVPPTKTPPQTTKASLSKVNSSEDNLGDNVENILVPKTITIDESLQTNVPPTNIQCRKNKRQYSKEYVHHDEVNESITHLMRETEINPTNTGQYEGQINLAAATSMTEPRQGCFLQVQTANEEFYLRLADNLTHDQMLELDKKFLGEIRNGKSMEVVINDTQSVKFSRVSCSVIETQLNTVRDLGRPQYMALLNESDLEQQLLSPDIQSVTPYAS